MQTQLLLAVMAGLCFGIWPAIVRLTNLSGMWVLMFCGAIATIVGIIGITQSDYRPTLGAVGFGLLAGAVNTLGQALYFWMIALPRIDLSTTVPLVGVLMVASGAIVAVIFFREPITISKAVGILLVCVAIYLLNR